MTTPTNSSCLVRLKSVVAVLCAAPFAVCATVLQAQDVADSRPAWVGLTVTCTIKNQAGAERQEKIVRGTDGSQRSESRKDGAETVDLTMRNRWAERYYRKLPDGEWLSAPLPGRAFPTTLASFQRAGWTLTDESFEGRPALRVVTPSSRQLIVPEFNYFSVEQDDSKLSVRCRDLKKASPAAEEFILPSGVMPKMFPSLTALIAYVDAKKVDVSISR